MTEPSKLVKKATRRLNTSLISVKQRAMAWSLSHNFPRPSRVHLHHVYVCMTAHDSIGMLKIETILIDVQHS